jgi:voltage-gated potassium channel
MSRLRRQLYLALEVPQSGTLGTVANVFLMSLITVNVVAVIFESVQPIYAKYETWFEAFEILSVAIFTAEYGARLWACVEARSGVAHWQQRLRYVVTPMALIDLLAVLPFYLSAFVNLDMRFLRALRLLRVFKLSRHSTAMDLLITVVRNELAIVASAMFVMLIIVVVAASGIYLIEREAQPDAFQSIPQAMWWAAVTLTTVGYGDMVPITVGGKVFGLFITLAGVGMVALPAGILASGFSQELQKRRAEFSQQIRDSLADGSLSNQELENLQDRSDELGIGADEALLMLRKETAGNESPLVCPHCGKRIEGVNPSGS